MVANKKFDDAHEEPPKNAQEAWKKLLEGNARFASGNVSEYLLHLGHEVSPARRKELGLAQHPFAVILTCSDSRVSPELIFDQGLGDIFVIRTAGNIVDAIALGSIEYGVGHLNSIILIVLGHTKCGAVTATLEFIAAQKEKKPASGEISHIGAIVAKIAPGAEIALNICGKDKTKDPVSVGVAENVKLVSSDILKQSPLLARFVAEGKLTVFNAVYDLDSGLVKAI
jgi:carbonic anhydrase